MSDNPLQRHFRRAVLWVKLPSGGRWYGTNDVEVNERGEIPIYGLTAIDEILLNTPDAMFNGHALQSVIKSCAPNVRNVKDLVQPDIEAIFLGIKAATNRGKFEINRPCPQCKHENTFDVLCSSLLDRMTFVEESDTKVMIDDQLVIHIKPYDYDMRTLTVRRQIEEQRIITEISESQDEDDLIKAERLADSVKRTAEFTFSLVADAIRKIEMLRPDSVSVTDPSHIREWLMNIDSNTANAIMEAINDLNRIGPPHGVKAQCQSCSHEWDEPLVFDPTLFFT